MATAAPPGRPGTAPAQGSGPTRKVGPFPIWIWIVGIGGIALVLRSRAKGQAAAPAPLTGGVTVDPNTGFPVDPLTGMPFTGTAANTTAPTLQDWIGKAYGALTAQGVSPALANKALYDYSSGNALDTAESGAINKALGAVGMPPITLPFFGTIPSNGGQPTPTPKPPPVPPTPHHTVNAPKVTPIGALPSQVHLLPGEHVVQAVRATQFGPSAGYYLSNLGGVFAVGGAQEYGKGSYLGLPATTRNKARSFVSLLLNPGGGYTEISNTGERYTFAPGK